MQKTEQVSIGKRPFVCDEDAYRIIRAYLDKAERALSDDPDKEEIMSDLEAALAEHLSLKLGHLVVDKQRAEESVAKMGDVQASNSDTEEHAKEEKRDFTWSSVQDALKRPLVKDSKREIVDGVCAGLARSVGIDPIWVRLLFVGLTILTSGAWIIVYIILVILMKEDPKGAKRTASEIVADLKETIAEKQVLKPYERKLKKLVRFVARLVVWSTRIVLCLVLMGLLIAWSVVFFFMFSDPAKLLFFDAHPGALEFVAIGSVGLVLILPLIQLFGAISKVTLFQRASTGFTMMSLWALSLVIAVGSTVNLVPKTRSHLVETQPKTKNLWVNVTKNGDIAYWCFDVLGGCHDRLDGFYDTSCSQPINYFNADDRPDWQVRGWAFGSTTRPAVISRDDFCKLVVKIQDAYAQQNASVVFELTAKPKDYALETMPKDLSGQEDVALQYIYLPHNDLGDATMSLQDIKFAQ